MSAWGLSEWGDIANIVIAVASVATAIVTARMLIKQHKLQQEQHQLEQKKHELEQKKHELDQEKLKYQQMEHQPVFYFKRNEDCLEICNSGAKLAQPIRFTVRPFIYIELSLYLFGRLKKNVTCIPIKIYKDCRVQEELDGIVARCSFNKEEREILHRKSSQIAKGISISMEKRNLQSQYHGLAGITIRDSDLITISYKDIYQKQHICYYYDSALIDEQYYNNIYNAIRNSQYKPNDIEGIDVERIVKKALQFRNFNNWQ